MGPIGGPRVGVSPGTHPGLEGGTLAEIGVSKPPTSPGGRDQDMSICTLSSREKALKPVNDIYILNGN
jgi:hypothetical protein